MAASPGLVGRDGNLVGASTLDFRAITEASEWAEWAGGETDDLFGAPLRWDSDDDQVGAPMLNFRAMIEAAEWEGEKIVQPCHSHTHVSQSDSIGREEEEEKEEEGNRTQLVTSSIDSQLFEGSVLNFRSIIEAAEWAGGKSSSPAGARAGQPNGTEREEESGHMPRPPGQVHFRVRGQSRATPTSSRQVSVGRAPPSHSKRKFPPILPPDQIPSEMDVTRIERAVLLDIGCKRAQSLERYERLKEYGLL